MFNDGAFELLDVHAMLPELKGRRGMSKWPVNLYIILIYNKFNFLKIKLQRSAN
jgi:hypothetical protein